MDGTYNLNELSLMSGFTTRTLRTYLNQGLLKGEKTNGAWRFTAEEVDAFFAQPFVKEGLRIKQSAVVFDFLADRRVKSGRACVVLVEQHGLAALDLDLVGLALQSDLILHLSESSLISLIERKRSSLIGVFSSSATMAISMAATRGSVS